MAKMTELNATITLTASEGFIADSKEIAGIAVRGSHRHREERWEDSARRSAGAVPHWGQQLVSQ
jgi:hypothetical protein